MKVLIKNLIRSQMLNPLVRWGAGEKSFILMFHRVDQVDENRLLSNESLKVSSSCLESLIADGIKMGYEFISLDKLISLNSSQRSKKVVITFDDGYSDNFHNAYPILKKNRIPFTIYLTTSFIGSEILPWWFKLEDILLSNDFLEWEKEGYDITTIQKKNNVFLKIRERYLNSEIISGQLLIQDLESRYPVKRSYEKLFLTWDEVGILASDPLVTIACHGHNHLHLTKLPADSIKREFLECKEIVEAKVGTEVKHICYPYGDFNDNVFNSVLDLGFSTGTLTKSGVISEDENHRLSYPRIFVSEGITFMNILQEVALTTRFGLRSGA